jgi:hypothetical protein
MTSSMCTYDPIANKLVDVAFVGVVVPLGVVQKGCSANHIKEDARK